MVDAHDKDAIAQLKARYFRLLDTANWIEWRRLFADDARLEIDGIVRSPDELVDVTRTALRGGSSIHQAGLAEIEFVDQDSATAIWAMEDRLYFGDGSRLHGWGHYYDTYTRQGADWLISGSVLTRLRVEHVAATGTEVR